MPYNSSLGISRRTGCRKSSSEFESRGSTDRRARLREPPEARYLYLLELRPLMETNYPGHSSIYGVQMVYALRVTRLATRTESIFPRNIAATSRDVYGKLP